MNVELLVIGKLHEPYLRQGCQMYVQRLRTLQPVVITELRSSSKTDGIAAEGERILERVPPAATFWALDERGAQLTSLALAARIAQVQRSGVRRFVLAIGGDRGLSEAVCERAQFVWSLSKSTFLHEMARLLVLEQLYRAAKINRGEPYHRP